MLKNKGIVRESFPKHAEIIHVQITNQPDSYTRDILPHLKRWGRMSLYYAVLLQFISSIAARTVLSIEAPSSITVISAYFS